MIHDFAWVSSNTMGVAGNALNCSIFILLAGWCTYYTCLKRLSTFYAIVALDTDYELWLTGSNPEHWRFHLLNVDDKHSIRLKIWNKNLQRKDVYKNDIFIEPQNVLEKEDVINDKWIPDIKTDIGGANYHDFRQLFLHVVCTASCTLILPKLMHQPALSMHWSSAVVAI